MLIQPKNKLAFILENARWRALPQSAISAILAICIALNFQSFNLIYAIIAFIGIICAHLSANLLDDIFDYLMGKVEIRNQTRNGRTIKCQHILDKSASIKDFIIWAISFGAIAVCIGAFFIFKQGLPILYFIIAGGLLSIFYSAPPFKLSYRGLGELVIGLMFGPLLVCGMFFASTGIISKSSILLSLATGLLATNIVYVHSMVDTKIDTACEKQTLATILKTKQLQLIALSVFTFVPYVIGFIVSPILGFLLLITLPIAIFLIQTMKNNFRYKILFRFLPKKAWKYIIKTDNEFFYTRWLLARNFMTLFVGIICLYYLCEALL